MIEPEIDPSNPLTEDRIEAFERFSSPRHVGCPNFGDRDRFMARVNEIWKSRWLTNNGPYVQEFEKRIADYVGVRHCVAMVNATVALEIATRALNFHGEVIIPSFTFVATAHALGWQEITPVFCDVDRQTHVIDPSCVERLITPRTTGIIGVHIWGRACPIEALQEIADRRGLRLMFDAAHAFGCTHRGQMIGGFGDCEVFSFHATKFLNSGEGGAVVTNNGELAEKLRFMRNFGFSGYDEVSYVGTNGKMNELSAALGLTNLESIDQFIEVNKRNHAIYREELNGAPGLLVHEYDFSEKNSYQYVVIEIDHPPCRLSRDEIVQELHRHNVLARRYFFPGTHRMQPYASYYPNAGLLLPETERLAGRIMLLPTGTGVTPEEVRQIGRLVCKIVS